MGSLFFSKKYSFMSFQLILSFKSFEPKLISNALKNVQILAHKLQNGKSPLDLFSKTGASPTKIKKLTVLSSPHIDKKAREQFEADFSKTFKNYGFSYFFGML